MMAVGGVHITADLYGCPSDLLERSDIVLKLLNEIVKEADFTKVGETYHQFKPVGATAVILLAESHISIHTWPEKNFASVDIFSCTGEVMARKALSLLKDKFKFRNIAQNIIVRG